MAEKYISVDRAVAIVDEYDRTYPNAAYVLAGLRRELLEAEESQYTPAEERRLA